MPEVSPIRLYALRALYLLICVGQGTIQWPTLATRASQLTFWNGIGVSMLGALALVSALGVRYPLQMLPLMLFEFVWKLMWVLAVWLPKWLGGSVDAVTAAQAPEIMAGVIVPLIIPWRYVIAQYVTKPGDSWSFRRSG
ncbi:MAG: hypothetical protein U0132_17205 [Gemmatimonadaceae bacterium]